MEPPAVTSSHAQSSLSSNGRHEKVRRSNTDFLQIDPSSTFSNARSFEELPENFLETISPQQTSQPVTLASLMHGSGGAHDASSPSMASPNLAPLAPMSIGNDQGSSNYLMGLGNMGQQYHRDEVSQLRPGALEKTNFGNGPAGLLSPLHMDGRRPSAGGSDFRHGVYIKEEADPLDQHHLMMSSSSTGMSSHQQEMERLANAETPPAVSNVELASTMIASLIGEQRNDSSSPSGHYGGGLMGVMKNDGDDGLEGHSNGDDQIYAQHYAKDAEADEVVLQAAPSSHSHKARKVYSTNDKNDPLNAEIDDDIYIDTKELCKRIAYELKQHSIPQAIFAERILCRSQGTLSDLLRNPKPWNKLKSGRETFRRMFNWVQQPLAMRLGILDMYKTGEEDGTGATVRLAGQAGVLSPPTPAQNVRHTSRARAHAGSDDATANKRPRLVFTDIQKRTLQAIFKETQRPSREMQQTIAEHLRLDLSTVANFFMNARRRSRVGPTGDEPAPYQQVRPITPPPDSPPPRPSGLRRQPAHMPHIEATVSSVAEEAIQYSRRLDQQAALANELDENVLADGVDGELEGALLEEDVEGGEAAAQTAQSTHDSPVDVDGEKTVKQEAVDEEPV